MSDSEFTSTDYWKSLVLYGLNTATYKIALANVLLDFANDGIATIAWEQLSESFFNKYLERLDSDAPLPQQGIVGRQTVMERIVNSYRVKTNDYELAISEVGAKGFNDVIRRFHNLGRAKIPELGNMFYEFDFGKSLTIKDSLFKVNEHQAGELLSELDARWSLLEGAFSISNSNYALANDLRQIYLSDGYSRRDLTGNISFLQGYQGNTCFYCRENIPEHDIHVDHVLPRAVIQHDEVWNLALAHSFCNLQKSDRIVGEHFIRKLVARNENIMGSNHPWKARISAALGATPTKRRQTTMEHYSNVCNILNWNYWGGHDNYSPNNDPFYSRLITVINNRGQA